MTATIQDITDHLENKVETLTPNDTVVLTALRKFEPDHLACIRELPGGKLEILTMPPTKQNIRQADLWAMAFGSVLGMPYTPQPL